MARLRPHLDDVFKAATEGALLRRHLLEGQKMIFVFWSGPTVRFQPEKGLRGLLTTHNNDRRLRCYRTTSPCGSSALPRGPMSTFPCDKKTQCVEVAMNLSSESGMHPLRSPPLADINNDGRNASTTPRTTILAGAAKLSDGGGQRRSDSFEPDAMLLVSTLSSHSWKMPAESAKRGRQRKRGRRRRRGETPRSGMGGP